MEEKLRQLEKQLADALNAQNELEKAKRELAEKLESAAGQAQRFKNELEDARSEADKALCF